jgi:hypothetical protein
MFLQYGLTRRICMALLRSPYEWKGPPNNRRQTWCVCSVRNGMIPEPAQNLIGALARRKHGIENMLDSATPSNQG